MNISTAKRPPVPRIQRCWQCDTPTGDDPQYRLSYGRHGSDEKIHALGYYCTKNCLWAWLTDHWDEMTL